MKKHIYPTALAVIFLLFGTLANAQAIYPTICSINAGANQSVCAPNCVTLTGTFVPTYATTSYVTSTIPYTPDPFNVGTSVFLSDDQWSGVIPLPFTFCFYGSAYNSLLIGSNGLLTFNTALANGYCQWPISAAVPSTLDPMNSIMGAWQDLYPPGGGQIRYTTYGVAPCRRFVVSWYQVPMYACTTTLCTQQLTLYENTNVIDNFIQAKPLCASWNGGRAIQALHNANGTLASVVAGRNSPTNWTAFNDAKRWSPSGASTSTTSWYQGATAIATTLNNATGIATATVCPTTTTVYTLKETTTNCNGVQATVTSTMTVTATSLTLSGTQTNINCFGSCTGSASVSVVVGTGPFTYVWTPSGGTGSSASGLCAGTYTCAVTGAGGCTGTQTFNITQPPAITLTPSQTNITCFGSCNGSATVTATGGNGTYTYAWAPSGGTGPSATGLCPGTYTCTVSSPAGCTATQTFNITQPPAITLTPSQTNITCYGSCNGSATVTATGGTGTYTYLWAPSGGTGPSATGLCAGTYTCTVSSPAGCTATQTFNITQPPAITVTPSQTNITCFGSCNGSATVTASGGTGTYTYAWAPSGGTGATATGLCAGTYTCTVSSPAGCTATQTFNITQPPAITLTPSQTNILCNGSCTGVATVTASGGNGTYTYAWAPSGGTGASATGLCAGTYTCTVSSPAGCTATQTFNITQPPALTATITGSPTTCGNPNGSATVTVTGGSPGYSYAWAPSGGNTSVASGLTGGIYTVTVTDANGCVITQTISITSTSTPTATITSQVNVNCFGGNNGSATVTASGGTGTYTYNWAPSGGTGATASSLTIGVYTVTVTDGNGCTATATVNITQPPAITLTPTQTNVLCNGGNTGSATVTASGGTGTYTYAWAPSGGTGATETGLAAGTYTVTVSSPAGCTATQTFNITQPPALTITPSQVNLLCNGANTGSATATVTGGTGTYTYSWAPSGGTGATASNLTAGNYTVTVTDANGCILTQSFSITQPSAIVANATATTSTCGNANGTASVTVTGGTGTYTYNWAPSGGTGSSATGLAAGIYTVTVTDANGCISTATATVGNAPSPTVTITATTNITCYGGNTGSATGTAVGGGGGNVWSWSPSGGNAATASGLTAGTYTCTVTDINGCQATATVNITQPPAITLTPTQTNVLCNGGNTGSATVVATGGTGTYTYSWAPSGGTGATATGLTAGSYTVTVSSPAGCTATQTYTITQPTPLTTTASQVDELCFGGNNGSATVTPAGGAGGYQYNWAPSGGTGATASNLSSGNYTVTITDANGCTLTQSFNITQPTAISTTVTMVPSTCGNPNGTATVAGSGGTGTYLYNWAPSGGTGSTATGLSAGTYTVTVTDANGCTAIDSITVTNMGSPSAQITASTNILCFGGNNGDATVTVTGGTGTITYNWSPSGGTNATGTGMTAGSYTVTVTDTNGCTDTAQVTLTEPPLLTVSTSQIDVLCFGNATGSGTGSATGGAPGYTYLWSNGDPNATATGLVAGSYTVTATDANGCTDTASLTITEPPQLTMAIAGFNVTCNNACDGQVVVIPGGGTPNYVFAWNTGCSTPSCNNICAGSYTCTITDANGCMITDSTTVTQPTAISITTSSVSAHCNLADGSATASASGGTGTLTYSWIGGPVNATWNNIAASNYTVVVTDANGCDDTAIVAVNNLNGVNATQGTVTDVSCFGQADGSMIVNASGGNPGYTYSWLPNVSVTDTANGVPAGNYQVTVTDANGCTSTITITVTQPPQLIIPPTASPASICAGGQVQLSATPGGGTPAYNVSWNPGNIAGTSVTLTPQASTTYTVTATDANGCTASDSVNVTVFEVPNAGFVTDIQNGCAPVCVNFSDISTVNAPGNINSWNWDFGDGNTASSANPNHCYSNDGTFSITLSVTTSDGCSSTVVLSNYIEVYANPVAAFSASPQPTTVLNPEVFFTDSSTNASSWLWSFGDLTNASSVLQNPSFVYQDANCYDVLLTVTSADGCTDTASKEICIDPDISIYVPNTFTPNEDGTNEIFLPVTIGYDPSNFEMWIFDRWGNMIYYTDDINKGWDGRAIGASDVCQIDTYVWKIKAKDLSGNNHNMIGHINLIK